MILEKYDSYKDSGLEWLGEIPKQWRFYRIDWINKIVRGNTGFKKDELLDNGEYIALQYGKTYKVDEINETFKFYVNNEFYKSNQTVHYGDTILISTSETIEDLRHSCFYNRNNIGLIGGEQILLKPNSKFIFDKYLYYYSKIFFNGLSKYATGLKVFRFNIDDLKNIVLWLPNITEQTKIATYLDTQTQKIDKEIKLLEEKSLKYKELKQTLINETVLRGLERKVKLKDSGIEWIGDIPSHWEVKRLKDLGNLQTSSVNKKIDKDEKLIKIVNYIDVYNNPTKELFNKKYMIVSANTLQIKEKKLKQGDVLFTPSSETMEDIGVSSVVFEDLKDTLYSYHILRLRFTVLANLAFKKYLFNNNIVQYYFSKSSKGTTRKILGLNNFYSLNIPLPPLKEQKEIATYLDEKTQKIDTITKIIKTKITLLKEFRKTLINDVVTGKVKVCD